MHLTAKVEIDDFELHLNDKDMIEAMARRLQAMVKDRTMRGRGADGKTWRPPEDDPQQKPLQRSGEFVESIAYKLTKHKKTGIWTANVQSAPGLRSDAGGKKATAAAKQKAARAAARAAYKSSGELLGGAKITKTGRLSVSKIRHRTADTNGALAAILSLKAKDERSKHRQIYRVYEATSREVETLFGVARTKIKPKAKRIKTRGRRR